MKVRLKVPPRHRFLHALRRAFRPGIVGACVWCGHGYRRFSRKIEAAHLKDCAEYQRASSRRPKILKAQTAGDRCPKRQQKGNDRRNKASGHGA
jgi:hypothetical protein